MENNNTLTIKPKNEPHKTLVCVTSQMECEHIIKAGRVIADLTGTTLAVLNVSDPDYMADPHALDFLFTTSRESDAMMTVTFSDNPAKSIIKYIKHNKVANVVTGIPSSDRSPVYDIWQKFTHVNFFSVEPEGDIREVSKAEVLYSMKKWA